MIRYGLDEETTVRSSTVRSGRVQSGYGPASVDRRWQVSANARSLRIHFEHARVIRFDCHQRNWVNVERTISSFTSTLIYTLIYTQRRMRERDPISWKRQRRLFCVRTDQERRWRW